MSPTGFSIHGCLMWTSWFLGAQIQLLTHRYLHHKLWAYGFCIHAMTGTLMCLVTIGMAVYAMSMLNYKMMPKYIHFFFVFPVFFAVGLITLLGLIAKCAD